MRISDRYIAKQIITGTLSAVLLLSVILVMGVLFRDIRELMVEQNAPLDLVGKFVLNILPFPLVFTLPWAFLATILLVFGRLSATNEMMSLRGAGLSLVRISLPVFLIGIVLCVICNYLAGTVTPLAKAASKNIFYEALRRDPSLLLEPGVTRKLPGVRVYVEQREGMALDGLHVYTMEPEPGTQLEQVTGYIHAEEAALKDEPEKKTTSSLAPHRRLHRNIQGRRHHRDWQSRRSRALLRRLRR